MATPGPGFTTADIADTMRQQREMNKSQGWFSGWFGSTSPSESSASAQSQPPRQTNSDPFDNPNPQAAGYAEMNKPRGLFGGSKTAKKTRTDKKATVAGKSYSVYEGPRGGKYIKRGGKFVRL